MNYNRCKICNSIDQTKKWSSKTLCFNCYQKNYVKNNDKKRKCIACESTESKGSWYRGPKCSKCYHNNRYKKNRGLEVGQKYCHLIAAARKKGHTLLISKEEYIDFINKGCYYCGRNLHKITGSSLDRIDGSKGYLIDNVVPCCGDCNTIKNSILTKEETVEVLKLIKKLRNTDNSPWEI